MCFSLKTCCCCISLEVGAQIIAIISLITPLAELTYCVWSALMFPLSEIKIIAVFVILAILSLFEAFCACLLIRGVFAKKPNSTIPWLVVAWVKSFTYLIMATFGITALVLKPDFLRNPDPQALNPGNSTTVATPANVTESAITPTLEDVPADTINIRFIVYVVVCVIQAFLLMYFAIVVNSRRKQIRDDRYSNYAPVRTDSIRNVFVPITKQIHTRNFD